MRIRCGVVLLAGLPVLAAIGLSGAGRLGAVEKGNATATAEARAQELYKRAQADGKYRMLLRQIKVEKDVDKYTRFKDLGYRDRRSYGDYENLPAGWWVYVAPYWFIWRDNANVERQKRGWGPEQATGEPDTLMAGDIVTAWASASPDGQKEWLMLEYEDFIQPTAVLVHETFNPGALYRVTAFDANGEEVEVWSGTDPTPATADKGVSEIPVKTDFKTNRIKLYLDSPAVPGWNEIDAVGLRDKAKKVHWAVAADASSTYAPPFAANEAASQIREDRINRLEKEVEELKTTVEELKKELKKVKDK